MLYTASFLLVWNLVLLPLVPHSEVQSKKEGLQTQSTFATVRMNKILPTYLHSNLGGTKALSLFEFEGDWHWLGVRHLIVWEPCLISKFFDLPTSSTLILHVLGSHIVALLLLSTATTAGSSRLVVVVVIVVVGSQDLLSQLLLSLVDISVKFVSILSNRELLVIINRDVDFPVADWLIVWVVELSNVGVS